jgi:serine/threonine-protein phosphatase 2A regulatory subunit A
MDQVLLIMASVLGDFLPYVGGPDYAAELSPILEKLCCCEDIVVRITAGASVCKILSALSVQNVTAIHAYFDLFQRLCSEDGEVFYGRMSACHMAADIYRLLPPTDKDAVLQLFQRLVSDEISMVRRGAGQHFLKLVDYVEGDAYATELAKIMRTMLSDENLAVRALAYENVGHFAASMKRMNASLALMTELASSIRSAVDDPSWRVRQVLAKGCGVYPASFPASVVSSLLFPGLISLIQDVEPDVRVSSLDGTVPYVASVGSNAFLTEFIPIALHLSEDSVPGVRKALVESCILVAGEVTREAADCHHLFEIVGKLAQDDDPLVRLRILRKLDVIAEQTPSLCEKLTESIKRMFKDINWRVRRQVGSAMADVVKYMGRDFFCGSLPAGLFDPLS